VAHRSRAGFTLIEMLIAIVIASIAVIALYSLFIVQSRQFLYQDLNMQMHQNLRFAVDVVGRSVRMAGHNTSGRVTGVLGEAGAGTDLPAIIAYDGGGPDGETDAITVVYGDANLLMPTNGSRTPACSTDTLFFRPGRLDYAERLDQFSAGELALCYDYADLNQRASYLWTVTGEPDLANGELPVADNSSYADYLAVCGPDENLSPVIACTKGHVLTFYIDADDTDGVGAGTPTHPVLMMDLDLEWPDDDDVPLIDDVEDLQFQYCVDTAGTGVDCSLAASWTDTVTPGQEPDVWMVRMSVLVRSPRTDPADVYTNSRPAIANRGGSATVDRYYRQVITTELAVRNLRIQGVQ
jgi:prepilin-type N-terminal cleavage/methylation domain-containing protein